MSLACAPVEELACASIMYGEWQASGSKGINLFDSPTIFYSRHMPSTQHTTSFSVSLHPRSWGVYRYPQGPYHTI